MYVFCSLGVQGQELVGHVFEGGEHLYSEMPRPTRRLYSIANMCENKYVDTDNGWAWA